MSNRRDLDELVIQWRHNAQGCSRKEWQAAGAWRSCARQLQAALATQQPASGDRDALNYLMGQFDGEVFVCTHCGNEETTANCDSAIYLRDYLATTPAIAAHGGSGEDGGDPNDVAVMEEALGKIAKALGCSDDLESMLQAIDRYTTSPSSASDAEVVPFTDAAVHAIQSRMAELRFVVPVRVISDGLQAALTRSPARVGGVTDAMVERLAIVVYEYRFGLSHDVAVARWPQVEQKHRFIDPVRAAIAQQASP